jgi:hypothetical protein
MKNILFLAILAAATVSMSAEARVPADRIVALTPDWVTNKARQSDSYLIAAIDSAGRVASLCGNVSHQCVARVYRTNAQEPADR